MRRIRFATSGKRSLSLLKSRGHASTRQGSVLVSGYLQGTFAPLPGLQVESIQLSVQNRRLAPMIRVGIGGIVG